MQRHRENHRIGFTLVELLVVIAIIAILAALGTWGVFAMIGNQQRRNTEGTIRVVHKVLQSHWKHVIDEAAKESPSDAVRNLAGGDPARAKVIWIKLRLMEAFPQNSAEVLVVPGTPPTPPFVYRNEPVAPFAPWIPVNQRRYIATYQGKIGQTSGSPAACLLMALSVKRGSSSLNEDEIKYAVNSTRELIDGFNRPLSFTRFQVLSPAENPAANTGATSAKYADPVDPHGTLLNSTWYNSPYTIAPQPVMSRGQYFDANFHMIRVSNDPADNNPPTFNYSTANFIVPVIGSQGKNPATPADDILSYKLQGE